MFYYYFLEGLLIGMLASMPLGPVSILIIQRTVNRNRLTGFFSGAGAAFSDTIYATIAGFSMVLVIGFIRENEMIVRILGSMVLIVMGLIISFSHPERYEQKNTFNKPGYFRSLFSTFLITLTNPAIIFLHLAIFSGFGVALTIEEPYQAFFILLGFLIGAFIWWFTLTGIISLFRKRFSMKICLWFNRIAGSTIVLLVIVSFLVWLGN
jgi:threonine/homoserine/homoserine lactone efflux protein